MKYKHVIFDIDGTMLDSQFADLSALQRVMRELTGKEYEFIELYSALGIPGEAALMQLGVEDTIRANELWSRYMRELGHTMKLFTGVAELIIGLKNEGFRLGIVTSKNKIEYQNDFVPFGIDRCFDTIICVDDCKAPKPSPEPMLSYMQKTGAQPDELLYIGDTNYDSECARSAGVDFGLALWGCNMAKQIDSTYSFPAPEDVFNLLTNS